MKFTDVRTLESVLKEYGLQSGAPTPVGQQTSGAVAKATAAPTKAPKKDLGSPTVTQGLDIPKIGEPEAEAPQPMSVKAKDLDDGAEYLDDKGEVGGTVVSKVGAGTNPDKLVVQDTKGEYTVIDPEDELSVMPTVEEAKSGKYSKKVHKKALQKTSKSKNSVSSVKQKIKKLARKIKLKEQGTEDLFEINFNNREIIKSALDHPIKCGFEAETVWEGYSNGYGEDVDDLGWSELEDRIYEQYGRSSLDDIQESFSNWIMEDKMYEYESDIIAELVDEYKEDEDRLNDFIDSQGGPTEGAIDQYKEDFEDNDPAEYQNRIEDGWEYMNWVREYVEEEQEDEYLEWLAEDIREDGEATDRAYEQAVEDLSMEDFIHDKYTYNSSMLDEHDIYISTDDGDMSGIGNEIENWAEEESITSAVEVGEYHSNSGTNNNFWRVEDDSSIEGDGLGAEIISPVYETPREMLEEMKSLFGALANRNVETNRSTGLHVTMSWNGDPDAPTDENGRRAGEEVNPVKLAVLLGDKYLLSTFGRDGNNYAKSQYANLEKRAEQLKRDPSNTKNIKAIEDILSGAISHDKFTAINFKDMRDNESGNKLVEFRIGGGYDYHTNMPTIVKAVVRYAETLKASYTDDHQKSYVKALFKLINNIDKIGDSTEERAKRQEGDISSPVIDVLKGFFSKENYIESTGTIASAYKILAEYNELIQPDADEKWAQQKDDSIKEDDSYRPGNDEWRALKPSKKAPSVLAEAQKRYVVAVMQAGHDLNQNLNRQTVNAKSIGVMRKSLAEFQLTTDKVSLLVNKHISMIQQADRYNSPQNTFERTKNGVDRIFKKDVVETPDFITPQQSERVVTGLWNVINYKDKRTGADEPGKSAIPPQIIKLITDVSPLALTLKDQLESISMMQKHYSTGEPAVSSETSSYKQFSRLISNNFELFQEGSPMSGEAFDKLLSALKKYPKWDHAVSRVFDNSQVSYSDESYISQTVYKQRDKLQTRFRTIDAIRETDPAQFTKVIKSITTATEELVNATYTKLNTDLTRTQYEGTFQMQDPTKRRIMDAIRELKSNDYRVGPFDERPALQFYHLLQNFIFEGLEAHHSLKADERVEPGYLTPEVVANMKPRADAVAKWLQTIDKIAVKIGFDSQSSAIDNKLNALDKRDTFIQGQNRPAPAQQTANMPKPGEEIELIDPDHPAHAQGSPISDGQEYDKARSDWPGFNAMMQNGMQNYLARDEVNHLVGFLNNPDNDSIFRSKVLGTIKNRNGNPFNSFQDALAVTRRQGNESVFNKFDKLSLEEQLNLLDKVNDNKLNKVYETFAANTTHLAPPKKKKKKATETIEAGQDVSALLSSIEEDGVPDLNKIKILNKILADHFPVSDLKKQMLAYEAIPIPQMLTDFRGLRAGSGDDACARGIVRHYIQALTKEEQKQIDLHEWSKRHVKKLLLTESDDKSDAKQLVQKSSTLSVIATVVNFLRGVVSRQEIDAYTTPTQPEQNTQQDTEDTEQQQEGKQQLVKEDLDQLKQEAFTLIGEVEDVAELNKVVAFLKKNEITELATAAIIANISQGVKGGLDQKIANLVMDTPGDFASKEKFLKDLGTGNGLWSGNVLITNLTGNIYDMLSSNPIASALAKPIALQLRGAMGYGPDQGPGEFLLALTGGGIDLAEKSDLVLIDGKGVEVKADGTSVGKSGKKSRSGGRLYSTGGYNGGSGARQVVKQAFMDLGITEDELEQYGWNGKIKGLTYFNLNFNMAGIKNMNTVLKKTPAGSAQKILYAIAKGFYIDVPENTDAFNNMINSYSGNEIDPKEAIFNFVALGHDYYKLKEGHDYIMIFNTATGGYVMIKDASDMKQLLDSGQVKLNGGMDFFDDRSKGTPQILTGNI